MRYFLDCEFAEDGRTIELISLALACEDGRELYLQNWDFDEARANAWVRANVLPHLEWRPPAISDQVDHIRINDAWVARGSWRSHAGIAEEVKRFILETADNEDLEFWGEYASYDWVAFCQLFGPMVDLPVGYPMFVRDVQQLRKQLGIERFSVRDEAAARHHALDDARETMARFNVLWPQWEVAMKANRRANELRATLHKIEGLLAVPAVEHVPAMREPLAAIDQAIGKDERS